MANRRRAVARAGHVGDIDGVRSGLVDPVATVRATALGALSRLGRLDKATLVGAASDHSPEVRSRAAELAVGLGTAALGMLEPLLADPDDRVAEAACFATGELGIAAVGHRVVATLGSLATSHRDPLCREAAVAALGAVGDPAGLAAILRATADKPAVRRRAVLALASFEGPEVDLALARALEDRDWQVRQGAEDLTIG